MTTATLRTTVGDINLLAEPEGIDNFEGLWARAIEGDVFGRTVRIASLDDLAVMKRVAGREKDLEDLRYISILLSQRD